MSIYQATFIPESLFKEKVLDLSNEKMERLPDNILKCTKVEKLLLNHNNLRDISILQKLKKLKILDISNNKIPNIELKKFKSLKYINLRNNPIEKLKVSRHLTIDTTQIDEITFDNFSGTIRYEEFKLPEKCDKKHFKHKRRDSLTFKLIHDNMLCQYGITKSMWTFYHKPIYPLAINQLYWHYGEDEEDYKLLHNETYD